MGERLVKFDGVKVIECKYLGFVCRAVKQGPGSLPYFVQHNDGGVEELKRSQNVHSVKVGVRNKQ